MFGPQVPDRDVGTLLVLAGAFVVAVGTVHPWLLTDYVGGNTAIRGLFVPMASSIASASALVASAGVCVLLATLAPRRFGPAFVLGTLAALIVIVSGSFVLAPASVASGTIGGEVSTPAVTVGTGPYVALLGGVTVLAGSLLWYAHAGPRERHRTDQ